MKRLLLTSALVLAGQGVLADEIRVLNWQGYGTDLDWAIAAYTEKTGNTVVHEYFTSEQEMLTKLRTNTGAYDVVLINSAYTAQAKDEAAALVASATEAAPSHENADESDIDRTA